MSIDFIRPEVDELRPRISVIGVGGAGGNAIANMIAADVQGVDFLVANTDAQALNASPAERRIQLGTQITQGLGAGLEVRGPITSPTFVIARVVPRSPFMIVPPDKSYLRFPCWPAESLICPLPTPVRIICWLLVSWIGLSDLSASASV